MHPGGVVVPVWGCVVGHGPHPARSAVGGAPGTDRGDARLLRGRGSRRGADDHVREPEFDQLATRASTLRDVEERRRIYRRLQEIIVTTGAEMVILLTATAAGTHGALAWIVRVPVFGDPVRAAG